MDKEKLPKFESGFSEKELDLAVDKGSSNNDQVKASTIFDPKKKIKPQK